MTKTDIHGANRPIFLLKILSQNDHNLAKTIMHLGRTYDFNLVSRDFLMMIKWESGQTLNNEYDR